MNISYKWLKSYIECSQSADEISKILTSVGLEVGTVETIQSIKGGLSGLVIGEVLTCIGHENSDHLHVTTVNVGEDVPLQIVCGAPNVAAGQKVVVATVGTTLYSGEDSFVIKKSKIRGVESFGMLCSATEIGVGADHDGIITLPEDTAVGTTAREYFGVEDDYLIEVDITPNRSDAISHYGVARDLAAYFNAHNIEYKLSRPTVDEQLFSATPEDTLLVEVDVADTKLCPRYAGITLKGIKIEESPKWLRNYLTTIGLKPINNIVDITNYILHSFGQPLHAFDAAKIAGNKVLVKTVEAGTKFTTLDGIERTLHAEDLMICNETEPMCIAGVFGGAKSGVTEDTTTVFIESAYFNPVSVRKTARRYGLNTDASFRYERGADPNIAIYALKYAAQLMCEIAGGKVSSTITDIYPVPVEHFVVELSLDKTRKLIGKDLSKDEVKNILKGLEMEITAETADTLSLLVPPYRTDVQRDVDVIEDILRIYGYNNIELSTSLRSNISHSPKIDNHKFTTLISEQLTANGFNEILNNSLTRSAYYEGNAIFPEEKCVRLMNSLSIDLNVMRQTLLYGGLESIAHNINRQHANLKFYEFGNCYEFNSEFSGDIRTKAFRESQHLSLWITGQKTNLSWAERQDKTTFYQLKAYVQNIFTRLGIDPHTIKIEELANDIYTQALVFRSRAGVEVATLGVLSSKLLKNMEISQEVFHANIQWDAVIKQAAKRTITYQEISKFPAVKRDLALLLDKQISFSEIEKIAFDTEKKLLRSVVLFDVYEGKNLPDGKKSYAVNFTLQDTERTLNDKQIDAIMQKLIKQLTTKLSATLR